MNKESVREELNRLRVEAYFLEQALLTEELLQEGFFKKITSRMVPKIVGMTRKLVEKGNKAMAKLEALYKKRVAKKPKRRNKTIEKFFDQFNRGKSANSRVDWDEFAAMVKRGAQLKEKGKRESVDTPFDMELAESVGELFSSLYEDFDILVEASIDDDWGEEPGAPLYTVQPTLQQVKATTRAQTAKARSIAQGTTGSFKELASVYQQGIRDAQATGTGLRGEAVKDWWHMFVAVLVGIGGGALLLWGATVSAMPVLIFGTLLSTFSKEFLTMRKQISKWVPRSA